MKTKIVQFSTNGVLLNSYNTGVEAEEKTGIKALKKNLSNFFTGRQRGDSLGGYLWAKVQVDQDGNFLPDSLELAKAKLKPHVVKNRFNNLVLEIMSGEQLDSILKCFDNL